jgi:hypothetical protein
MHNSTIKPSKCKECGSPFHSKMYHKPRKPILTKTHLPGPTKPLQRSATYAVPKRTPLPRPEKRIRQRSDKQLEYENWLEEVARPYLIAKYGNMCSCCRQYWSVRDKLDIEHTLTKGSRPDLKKDLDNLTLMCRYPCHYNKTNGIPCHVKLDTV